MRHSGRAALILILVAVGLLGLAAESINSSAGPLAQAQEAAPPQRPDRPAVNAVSHDSVTISWQASADSGITGYQILRRNRDTDPLGEFTVIEDDTGPSATTYTDNMVEPATRYGYRIKARNAHGLSQRSQSARPVTPAREIEPSDPELEETTIANNKDIVDALVTESTTRQGATDEDASDAEADSVEAGPVWSATLTVGRNDEFTPASEGYSLWGTDIGELTNPTIEQDGTHSRILTLMRWSGGVYLNVAHEISHQFVLTIDDQTYASSDSSEPVTPARGRYWWPEGSLAWDVGDTVEVSIAQAEDDESTGTRPSAPLIASFSNVPENHDGPDPFTVRLTFTESITANSDEVESDALDVSGGTITGVEGNSGSAQFQITVQPDSGQDVMLSLSPAADCQSTGSLCTSDGRRVNNDPEITVPALYGDIDFELPEGCQLEPLFNVGGKGQYGRWLKPCRSIYEYPMEDTDAATGLARYYRADVATAGEITVHLSQLNTTHHVLLRDSGGNRLGHIMIDRGAVDCHQTCYEPGEKLTVDVEPGTYVIEIVQHFSHDDRQREFIFKVGGDIVREPEPRLSDLSLNGATISDFDTETFEYPMDAPTAVVTVSATAQSPSDANNVYFYPADSDDATPGHQVAVNRGEPTDIVVRVTDPGGFSKEDYTITFFGAPDEDLPLMAAFVRQVPGFAGWYYPIDVRIVFSKPIEATAREVLNALNLKWVDIEDETTVAKHGDGSVQVVVIKRLEPDARGDRIVIDLPATTGCGAENSICAADGEMLGESARMRVKYKGHYWVAPDLFSQRRFR